MHKLTEIDKSILFEVDTHARESINQIAKKLRLKRDTVAYRLKQLESKGIIKGYFTLIDYAKLGYTLMRLYLKFQNTTIEREQEIISYLVDQASVFTVYKTEGDWDVATGFLVTSLEQFHEVLQLFLKQFRNSIYEYEAAVFLEYVHYLRNYLTEKKKRDYTSFSTGGKKEKISFDNTDLQLLQTIAQDARISLLDIAQKLKLSSMTIRYRMKQLEKKGVILGYRALIDYTQFGYEYYKIDLMIEDMNKLKQLKQFAFQHPHIIYEDKTVGGSDFEFDAELPNYDAFYALIEEIKTKFPGIIRTYKYYKARKIYKYVYFPEV